MATCRLKRMGVAKREAGCRSRYMQELNGEAGHGGFEVPLV